MACTGARSCIQRRINLIRGIVRYHTVMRRATVTITRDHLVILAAMKQYIATEMAALAAQPLVPATSDAPPLPQRTTRASSVTSGAGSDVFVDAPPFPRGVTNADSSSAEESDSDISASSSSRSSTNATQVQRKKTRTMTMPHPRDKTQPHGKESTDRGWRAISIWPSGMQTAR